MSLFKKIISSVCALSMLSAVAISAVSVQAEELGLVSAELTSYDSETGEGTVTVSFGGLADILANYDEGMALMAGFTNSVQMSADDFDTSLYGRMPIASPAYRTNIVKAGSWGGTFTPGPWVEATPSGVPGFTINCSGMNQLEDTPLYTFNFKVNDTSKDNQIVICDAYADINVYNMSGMVEQVVTYGDAIHGSTNTTDSLGTSGDTAEGTGGGDITITIPANDGTTAEGDNLVSITPEGIGGEGTVWTDDSGNGEAAVASVANFTSNNAGSVTWSITATPAEGEAVTKSHAFEIPAVEGQMTLGLIVGYDTAEWNSVAITGGAIE